MTNSDDEFAARRARRPASRRRWGGVPVDLAAGGLVALALLLIAPGLAIVAIVALIVLLICGLSMAVGYRRARRFARRSPRHRRQ